ncbi:hypothetical protein ANCCEY_14393 [Ancylostoma ceylanicum]|uniref:Uncharacterized protein n=1 Tax=Ancylostoma ceylanicum TaxID=53326 RepID=A0A0D6LFS3_9BILA|nr:hypothetical protein ANCCEY_14393 [Ancylostoma ceylanicum]
MESSVFNVLHVQPGKKKKRLATALFSPTPTGGPLAICARPTDSPEVSTGFCDFIVTGFASYGVGAGADLSPELDLLRCTAVFVGMFRSVGWEIKLPVAFWESAGGLDVVPGALVAPPNAVLSDSVNRPQADGGGFAVSRSFSLLRLSADFSEAV